MQLGFSRCAGRATGPPPRRCPGCVRRPAGALAESGNCIRTLCPGVLCPTVHRWDTSTAPGRRRL
eukprot:5504135-Alexandrium_andersonii.AAC.1